MSLREIAAMICGGERRVCLTASGKHNGSIHQEQTGRGTVGAEEETEQKEKTESERRRRTETSATYCIVCA